MTREAVWIEMIGSGNRSQSGARYTLGRIARVPLVEVNDTQAVIALPAGNRITVPRREVFVLPQQMQEAAERIWNYFHPRQPMPESLPRPETDD